MAGVGPERVWVQVIDVGVTAGREIAFGSSEQFMGRRR